MTQREEIVESSKNILEDNKVRYIKDLFSRNNGTINKQIFVLSVV